MGKENPGRIVARVRRSVRLLTCPFDAIYRHVIYVFDLNFVLGQYVVSNLIFVYFDTVLELEIHRSRS